MEAAARFLEARPRSIVETRRRLARAGYPEALVEQVLSRLVEVGYLDDEAFARAWVESRDRTRPRGATALRRELLLRGVAPDVIAAALERRGPAEAEEAGRRDGMVAEAGAAERVLARRTRTLLREPDARRRRDRAYALLARNGFDPETCRAAVRRWMTATEGATDVAAGTDEGADQGADEGADQGADAPD